MSALLALHLKDINYDYIIIIP